MEEDSRSIYKISRLIKRNENTLYNALCSIYEDSVFVGEISQLWPQLPLLANLRCGLWYSRKFDGTCYFKSTDGHTNNLSFSISRLNLHVANIAGQRGGCIIVDSTRKGKRFPDSMSKTIPIWTCVLNRAIFRYRGRLRGIEASNNVSMECELKQGSSSEVNETGEGQSEWDCSLHLPLWVSDVEKRMIESRLENWVFDLELSGAELGSISSLLKKPLRPLWISQRSVIWLNEVPDHDSWDFTPIILVSASSPTFRTKTTSDFSWNYIPGAGDDEESWARGLSPELFWQHAHEIVNSGPELCNRLIANIVEKARVRCLRRGEDAEQVSIQLSESEYLRSNNKPHFALKAEENINDHGITILGSTNIAVGKSHLVEEVNPCYCILNCDKELSPTISKFNSTETYLYLPFVDSKHDRFSILRNLPCALEFAKRSLRKGQPLFICCSDGEDISICVSLAILTSFYDQTVRFDDGKWFSENQVTKSELKKRLVFICKYAVNARPSRGNLRQVFACISTSKF